MLDSDLAKLYQVETKRINEAVKNNPQKFPQRFSWIMTNDELYNLWSKFSTANIKGELYDAYSVLIDIFNKSKEEIIIIDNYASKELLDIIKKYR